MTRLPRRALLATPLLATPLLATPLVLPARAQAAWPERPVKVIVPWRRG